MYSFSVDVIQENINFAKNNINNMSDVNLRMYQNLNNSFKARNLVFHLGADAGFYSEFNNMVLAIIYCLRHRIKFSVYSADANFKYQNGWEDYFRPFCEEVEDVFHCENNIRYEDPFFFTHGISRLKVLLWRMRNKRTYLTSDLFFKFRTTDFERGSFSFPDLGLKGDLRSVSRSIIDLIYRFNETTLAEIQRATDSLNLPKKYIGLHIRGGDKFIEHKMEECSAYISKAEQLSPLRNAFVLTDDYSVIQSLQRDYPDWTFYTLTDANERGYFHQEFLNLNVQERKRELIKLFSSMEVLRNSELFVGTFSSNPGMFLGMCMEEAYGIDLDKWTIW